MAIKRAYDANPYAAGKVIYGGGRRSPHVGTMLDPMGYRERDRRAKVRRNAVLRRMKQHNMRNFSAPDWLREKG